MATIVVQESSSKEGLGQGREHAVELVPGMAYVVLTCLMLSCVRWPRVTFHIRPDVNPVDPTQTIVITGIWGEPLIEALHVAWSTRSRFHCYPA